MSQPNSVSPVGAEEPGTVQVWEWRPRAAEGRARVGVYLLTALVVGALLWVQLDAVLIERTGVPRNPPSGAAVTGELAGARTAIQTFRMAANGFRSFTVHGVAAGPRLTGEVRLDLEEADARDTRLLLRVSRPLADVAHRDTYRFDFPPIPDSRGRSYRVRLSAPLTPFGEGIVLRMRSDDAYRDGSFVFDEREQWGDLAFDTDATDAVLWPRWRSAWAAYPPWMTAPAIVVPGWLGLNAWLAWTVLTGLRRERLAPATDSEHAGQGAEAPNVAEAAASGFTWRALAAGTTGAMLAAGVALAHERVAVDLVDAFPSAHTRTRMPTLHAGFQIVPVAVSGRVRQCIQALPPSRITWTVDPEPNMEVRVWAGMRPDVWSGPGDGAVFRFGVSDGTTYHERLRIWLSPTTRFDDRRWVPVRPNLPSQAGRRVEIIANTEPGPMGNAVGDAALWCAPRVLRR